MNINANQLPKEAFEELVDTCGLADSWRAKASHWSLASLIAQTSLMIMQLRTSAECVSRSVGCMMHKGLWCKQGSTMPGRPCAHCLLQGLHTAAGCRDSPGV